MEDIQNILLLFAQNVRKLIGKNLSKILVYGSYARGDYNENSDIDIMILVDLSDEEIDKYSDELAEVGFEYIVAHGIWMMPVVKNKEHFRHWEKAYPFYENVQREGVMLYEAA